MTALAARLPLRARRWLRPWLPQAHPLVEVPDLKTIPLRPWRFEWLLEVAKLIVGIVAVIAAVLIWVVKPWL